MSQQKAYTHRSSYMISSDVPLRPVPSMGQPWVVEQKGLPVAPVGEVVGKHAAFGPPKVEIYSVYSP